jgi:hypothetical protein
MPKPPTTTERGYGWAWTKARRRILDRHHWRCDWCGGRANRVDHVVPVSAGGSRLDARNLVPPACAATWQELADASRRRVGCAGTAAAEVAAEAGVVG